MVCRNGYVSRLTCAHDLANGNCDRDHKPCDFSSNERIKREGRGEKEPHGNDMLWLSREDTWWIPKYAIELEKEKQKA